MIQLHIHAYRASRSGFSRGSAVRRRVRRATWRQNGPAGTSEQLFTLRR